MPTFTDRGKASFLESEGVAILKKVAQESDDNELIDLVFEILSSIIIDGKYMFFCCCNSLWEGKADLSEQLIVKPTSEIELVIFFVCE